MKTIIIMDHDGERIIKIKLSVFDEYVINNRYEGNVEDWLATRYPDNSLFCWSEMSWMCVSEDKEKVIDRAENAVDCQIAFIDEILINPHNDKNRSWGLKTDGDEFALKMKFFDGFAIEVDDDWIEVPVQKDPVLMFYPTRKEVLADESLRSEVYKCTGRDTYTVFDIALTFGEIRRRAKYD